VTSPPPQPVRFYLTLTTDGRPAMHGWWPVRATADRKFREWIGEQGSRPGAGIVLVDEETGDALETWPGED
jgi:hypothetical protein